MTALLKREPQVFIFAHLSQFLNSSGVLIPQEVSLKAWANKKDQKNTLIGEFFKLDIDLAKAINNEDLSSFSGELLIPQACGIEHECALTTDITIYKQHHLTTNECSLNLPLTIFPRRANLIAGKSIKYEYVNPSSANFVFTFPEKNIPKKEKDLSAYDAKTNNGLILFKRIYERAQLNIHNEITTYDENECHAQSMMFELLELPSLIAFQALHEHASFELFEVWLNKHCSQRSKKIDVIEINNKVMNYLNKQVSVA